MNYTSGLPALIGALFFVSLGQGVSGQQPPAPILAPTFSQHVAPIVYAKCVQCHRPGEVAPMSLINYRDVQPWARSIRTQLVERTMPPFHSHSRYGLLVTTKDRVPDGAVRVVDFWKAKPTEEPQPVKK